MCSSPPISLAKTLPSATCQTSPESPRGHQPLCISLEHYPSLAESTLFPPPKSDSQALPWFRIPGLCPWTPTIPGPHDTSTLGHHRLPDFTLKPVFPSNSCFCLQQLHSPGCSGLNTWDCAPLGALAHTPHLTHQIVPESSHFPVSTGPVCSGCRVRPPGLWCCLLPAHGHPLCVISPPSKRWVTFKSLT